MRNLLECCSILRVRGKATSNGENLDGDHDEDDDDKGAEEKDQEDEPAPVQDDPGWFNEDLPVGRLRLQATEHQG